jgi:hypothetical protein
MERMELMGWMKRMELMELMGQMMEDLESI